MIMFLEMINTNYFFVVSDLCDSINQAIYQNNIPIYGKGLGWMSNCHSTNMRASGYIYNYELYQVYNQIANSINANPTDSEDLKKLQTEMLTTKKQYLDPILACDTLYSTLISNEAEICKLGSNRSYKVFINYFWLMIVVLFVFWGFNRNVPVIRRRLYDLNEKLMAEESAY